MEHFDSYDVSQEKDSLVNDISNHFSEGTPVCLPMEVTDEVVRFYSPMVYRIALTKTQSSNDASDIFQEVFLKLVMNTKPFETEEHRKAWLIRVTINCCNSHFTAPWRKNVDSLDDAIISELADETTDAYDLGEGPDVYAEVLKLPQNMREVILLYYYEEMSIREISQVLGTSEVNVKKRLSRARQKLKLELADDDAE
ncbi:MAG: RNA polymerase sigma factor [Ruminococcaceae bacterium]|nr:RNA polymerase sigma factor [Oscillospiraceae bacterium]